MSSSTESRLEALAGLESAKRVIRKIAGGDTGVHAVLLYGARGSGKTELAMALAEAWLCRNPAPAGADGSCQACGAFARGSSPDVLSISPSGPSNWIPLRAISKPSETKPDDSVPLQEFFRTPALMSRHKVGVLFDVHRLYPTAAASLLKTLEEPHAHAKLVLTTDSVGSVLPTILSRCLAIACELPEPGTVSTMATEMTPDDLRLAEGAPGRIKTILTHPAAYRSLAGFARNLKTRSHGDAIKASEEFRTIADSLQKATDGSARAANAEALDLLAVFLAREPGTNPRWPQHVAEAHRRIQGNASPNLVFDALFARLLRKR